MFSRRIIRTPVGEEPPVDDDFVMEVVTTGADESFTIPCQNVGVFNATIDWGDGSPLSTITSYDDVDLAHVYANAGTYDITISGTFPNIYFNNKGDRNKVTDVTSLGNVGWAALTRGFYGCSNIASIGDGDISNVIDLSYAWVGCSSLTSFPVLDTNQVTNFYAAWSGCSSLISFPLIDTSSGTNFWYAWQNCSSLTSFPLIDTSLATIVGNAWEGCSGLTDFPLINTSSATQFRYTWSRCSSLTSFPLIDTSSGTDFRYAWHNCSSLTSFPSNMFDSCPATNFSNAFDNCALSQTSVDNILVSIDTAGQSNGTLNMTGGTSASPGAAGQAAKTSLEGKGWTVTTN